jgi:hypothetical protein
VKDGLVYVKAIHIISEHDRRLARTAVSNTYMDILRGTGPGIIEVDPFDRMDSTSALFELQRRDDPHLKQRTNQPSR